MLTSLQPIKHTMMWMTRTNVLKWPTLSTWKPWNMSPCQHNIPYYNCSVILSCYKYLNNSPPIISQLSDCSSSDQDGILDLHLPGDQRQARWEHPGGDRHRGQQQHRDQHPGVRGQWGSGAHPLPASAGQYPPETILTKQPNKNQKSTENLHSHDHVWPMRDVLITLRLDRGSIRSSPRDGLSTPYR